MTRNALLPSSNYCQKIETTSDFKGQLSWTNVFREEIEILQMKGKYVLNVPQLEMIFLTQNGKVDSNTPQSSHCKVAATITCSAKFGGFFSLAQSLVVFVVMSWHIIFCLVFFFLPNRYQFFEHVRYFNVLLKSSNYFFCML